MEPAIDEREHELSSRRPVARSVPGRRPRVDKKELEMAGTLIERFTSSFDHSKYEDEYQAKLRAVVQRKRKGQEIHAPAAEEREAPPDLLEALRASVDSAKRARGSKSRPRGSSNGSSKTRKRRRAKSTR